MKHHSGLRIHAAILLVSMGVYGSALGQTEKAGTRPQPVSKEMVFLLHGLGKSPSSMWLLASRLESAGYSVVRVGYSSLDQTPDQILAEVSSQIYDALDTSRTTHFVGHSLGGLLIRAYLASHRVPSLGRVVLIGSPSRGTPLVDRIHDSWLMKILGPTTNALGTDQKSFPKSLPPPYYPVGIIAGAIDDGLNDSLLPGEDDGVVPLESTKVDGMTDMVVVKTGHSMMRYDATVAHFAIAFIRDGRFQTPDSSSH